DLLFSAADYTIHRKFTARLPAGRLDRARRHHGVLVAGVRITPTRRYAGAHGLQRFPHLQAVSIVHGAADIAADGGAEHRAADDCRGLAMAAADLRAEHAAERATDHHADVLLARRRLACWQDSNCNRE